MNPNSPVLLSALLVLFLISFAAADVCTDALDAYERGHWSEARELASSSDGAKDAVVCEFVLAAAESKAFARAAKLDLFAERHPNSTLASRARIEAARTLWLLGDVGGALSRFAGDADGARACSDAALIGVSLLVTGHGRQAGSWFARAGGRCEDAALSALVGTYELYADCGHGDGERCVSRAARLVSSARTDMAFVRGVLDAGVSPDLKDAAALRLYLLLRGYDEAAMFATERLGLLGYIAGRPWMAKRCLVIETGGGDFLPVEDAFWLWARNRGLEVRAVDGPDRVVVGPESYEELERLKLEIKRLFGLVSRIRPCPKAGGEDEREE